MAHQEEYHSIMFPLDDPRLEMARQHDARSFGVAVRDDPFASQLINGWEKLRDEPFHGLTCDGECQHGLFHRADEGAPVEAMVRAAETLLATLDDGLREKVRYPIDANEWRRWSNPEFLMNDGGLRLEDYDQSLRDVILAVIEASTSAVGYKKIRDCMRTNAFLGEICAVPRIMNEWSYNFQLFGTPSTTQPWGWNIYGHHLAINCFVLGRQMIISPTFMGAEPNVIDKGPHAGTRLFLTEARVGLELMQSLSADLQERSTIYKQMKDPAMPEGRWHPGDERHLGGAFRDNRVVPYEGVLATEFDKKQRQAILDLANAFLEYLPGDPRSHRVAQIEDYLDETRWSWIGGHGDADPFYYRIQSPIVMLEFDHHSGVWLANRTPAKCHIHTVVRTPNGNDYGKDLLRQHYAEAHPGQAPGVKA